MPISPPLMFLGVILAAAVLTMLVGISVASTSTVIAIAGLAMIVFGWGDLLWVLGGFAIVLLAFGGDENAD